MTELESKIWGITHRWCDAQYGAIPDQNRRYLMDEIKALVLSNIVKQSEQLRCKCDNLEDNPLNPNTKRCLDCFNVVTP